MQELLEVDCDGKRQELEGEARRAAKLFSKDGFWVEHVRSQNMETAQSRSPPSPPLAPIQSIPHVFDLVNLERYSLSWKSCNRRGVECLQSKITNLHYAENRIECSCFT